MQVFSCNPRSGAVPLEAVRECPFAQTLRHTQKNNPRNINYMPVVIFSSIPRFWTKLLSSDSLHVRPGLQATPTL